MIEMLAALLVILSVGARQRLARRQWLSAEVEGPPPWYCREMANFPTLALALVVLFGQVRDLTTGQPLPNVNVSVGSHHTTTDAEGRYRLTGLSKGTYHVTLSSDDVPRQQKNVAVGSHDTKADLKVCSTTLDYGCGGANSGPG